MDDDLLDLDREGTHLAIRRFSGSWICDSTILMFGSYGSQNLTLDRTKKISPGLAEISQLPKFDENGDGELDAGAVRGHMFP